MKTNFLYLCLAGMTLFFTSCERHQTIRPSGSITERDHSVSNYTEIEVSHAFNVYVKFSEERESIVVEANDNLHPFIEIQKKGNALCIEMSDHINIRGNATQNVYITTSDINHFEASGASDIFLENDWITNRAYINLSGASSFDAYLIADELRADLSGASELFLEGNCDYFLADISGASNIGDYHFGCNWFEGDLSGASEAKLTIEERIDISASGASTLNYSGTASVYTSDISGASEINRR